jgi:hypothetical protein
MRLAAATAIAVLAAGCGSGGGHTAPPAHWPAVVRCDATHCADVPAAGLRVGPDVELLGIAPGPGGAIWVTGNAGARPLVARWAGSDWQLVPGAPALGQLAGDGTQLYGIQSADDPGGVYRWDGTRFVLVPDPNDLARRTLALGTGGSVWVIGEPEGSAGTRSGLVERIRGTRVSLFELGTGGGGTLAASGGPVAVGGVAGNPGAGRPYLAFLGPDGFRSAGPLTGLVPRGDDGAIFAICRDGDGTLWVGGSDQLQLGTAYGRAAFVARVVGNRFVREQLPGRYTYVAAVAAQGNTIWALAVDASNATALLRRGTSGWRVVASFDPNRGFVPAIALDGHGDAWMAGGTLHPAVPAG